MKTYRRYFWLLAFGFFWKAAVPIAMATQPFRDIAAPAIPVRDVMHALLIGVTRAGNRIVAGGEHGLIIYSDDNGENWHQARVPVSVSIVALAFATPQIGWAAGATGVVLRTQDGGAIWNAQVSGVQANSLMLKAAAALADSRPTDADAAQRAQRRANILNGAGPDKPLLAVLAQSPQQAMILGSYRMCLRTYDGGTHWTDCSLNIPDNISHNLYDAQRIGGSIYIVGESGIVFRSSDNGVHFTAVTKPADDTLFGILGTKNGTILAFGVASGLFRSTDQGQSWIQKFLPTQSNLVAAAILESGEIIIVSETGEVYRSTDNGASFREGLGQDMAIFGLTEAANGNLVFVGSDGVRVVKLDFRS